MTSENVAERKHKYKYTIGTGKVGKFDLYFDEWNDSVKEHIKELTAWYVQNIRIRFN